MNIPKNYKLKLAKYYAQKKTSFDRTKGRQELVLSKELAEALGCVAEVKAPYDFGRIDCLSKDLLIECKYTGSTSEKAALGQLLMYAHALCFKGQLALGLIGQGEICKGTLLFCKAHDIIIFYYNINEHSPRWRQR